MVDDTYPREVGVTYVTNVDLEQVSPDAQSLCARLPQLALHSMAGNSRVLEMPTMRALLARMLTVGCLTSADTLQGLACSCCAVGMCVKHMVLDWSGPGLGGGCAPLVRMIKGVWEIIRDPFLFE